MDKSQYIGITETSDPCFHLDIFDNLYNANIIITKNLTNYNIAIECQGEQHFKPIEHFGGVERFVETLFRDKNKQEKCKNQNIKLIYIFEKIFQKNIIKNKILNELYSPYEKYIVNNNKIAIEIIKK